MSLFGGRKPINLMTKKEAVKVLAGRAKTTIQKKNKSDIREPDFDIPREISCFINPIKDKIKQVSNDIDNDKSVIMSYLEQMSDQQLRELKAIFEADKDQKKRMLTEDKLISAAVLTLDDIKKIDAIIPHLLHVRKSLVGTFVEAYSSEYSTNKGNDRVFANDDFVKDINHIMSYRSGIKRSTERSSESSEPNVQSQQSCSIM